MLKRTAWVAVIFITAGLCAGGEGKLALRPRVILTPSRVEEIRRVSADGDERFVELKRWGDANLESKTGKHLGPGYARGGWAEAARDYALLYLAEPDEASRKAYAEEALVYMRALADDYDKVGDGKGGLAPVEADSGYPIRNHAVGLAIGYDWLYGYEGFSLSEKGRFVERLTEWIDWYEGKDGGKGGYKKEGPAWENYFTGYYLAKVLTTAATYEENPVARIIGLDDVARKMEKEILPGLAKNLAGGYPPEGWAYRCGYDRTADALMTLENATGETFDKSFFKEVVYAVIHSTKPDRKHIYDGGDWGGDFAGYPLPLGLMARMSRLLAGTREAAFARYYVEDFAEKDRWNSLSAAESLIYMDNRAQKWSFVGEIGRSYISRAAGMVFFRSGWEEGALWGSFQSGGPHMADHQNRDQGHITLNFAGRDRLVDAGMWRERLGDGKSVNNFASTTEWHNTIMIDDLGKEVGLSQGYYGERKAEAFEDGEGYVYAKADITGAYSYYPWRKESNSAAKVTREIFYVRPGLLFVMDYVEPSEEKFKRKVLFHFPNAAEPKPGNVGIRVKSGKASLGIFSMLPKEPKVEIFRLTGTRPGDAENGVYTWGLQIREGGQRHPSRFLTVLSADEDDESAAAPVWEHDGSVIMKKDGKYVWVGWPRQKLWDMTFRGPFLEEVDLYVVGLEPGTTYAVDVQAEGEGVVVRLTKEKEGARVSQSGVLGVALKMQEQLGGGGRRPAGRRLF